MPITEDRLKTGTLTLDAVAFATQATNVRLVPSTEEEGDEIEVLSGDTTTTTETYSWTLAITAIQDFDDPAGFVAKCLADAGEEVAFSWRPNSAGVTYAGTVRLRPVEIGGDVNTRLTTDAEFPLTAGPTPTYPA